MTLTLTINAEELAEVQTALGQRHAKLEAEYEAVRYASVTRGIVAQQISALTSVALRMDRLAKEAK
jgi:hypothetical protein